jgi:prevent-host-death family protein
MEFGMHTEIISLTEFKNDASGWIERLQSQPPVVLTQNGRGKAVVMSFEAYRQMELEMALLARLTAAKRDEASGKAKTTEQVFASARKRLAARKASRG